ncbi:hypothetical protein GCM10010329_51780 [Streptomyces spiroverticillatus]|uniref:MlaB-like STAS domain-containing protein n=1 Tax=Streptomyces finlayi TaxID=67296 RepID=A0A919CCA1_9ACTN|nr:STAS domain-containing protein [Streptomyces finlayi]GHA22099.1 hypothetical protein GCM10010329_51780 [Streptomyces spiroverticillatus]GHD04201.1 hypothetical protein GCM10010334_52720 [Streptomyces finlayi]
MSTATRLSCERYRQGWDDWIVLYGELDLDGVPLLARAMDDAPGRHGCVHVQLQSVSFCDVSGLNALLAAAARARAAGRAFRAHRPPPVLVRLCDIVGCTSVLLGDPAPRAAVAPAARRRHLPRRGRRAVRALAALVTVRSQQGAG